MSLSLKPEIYNCFIKHKDWPAAKLILDTLSQAGFKAYLAGGCVRDALLNRPFQDFDVATSALPEETEKLFTATLDHGKKFGTIVVLTPSGSIEVTTFRKDLIYTDGRHPLGIQFSDEVEDAKRRDFTMNALFYDIQTFNLVDHIGGVKDIENQMIRAVGHAKDRFFEDHLRMLRALRFQSQLGFKIDNEIIIAIKTHQLWLQKISAERIQKELLKIFLGDFFEICLTSFEQIGFDLFMNQYFESSLNKELFYDIKKWPKNFKFSESSDNEKSLIQALLFLQLFICLNANLLFNDLTEKELIQIKKRIIIFKNKMKLDNSTEKKMNSFFSIYKSVSNILLKKMNSTEEQALRGYVVEIILQNWSELAKELFYFLNSTYRNFESNKSKVNEFEKIIVDLLNLVSIWQFKLPNKILNSKNLSNEYSGAELGQALKLSYYLQLAQPDLSREKLALEIKKVGPVFLKS